MADVSVIVPAHDAAGTVASTIASLASERAAVREIILVDDASIDGTAEVAERQAAVCGLPLRVLSADCRDSGGARNIGIAAASGTWLYFLDADDEHLAGGLTALLATAAAEPATGMAVGGFRRIVDGVVRRPKRPHRLDGDPRTIADRYIAGRIRSFAVGSVLVRAGAAAGVCFPLGMPYDEDTIFWAHILRGAPVARCAAMTMVYRLSTARADGRFLIDPIARFERWRAELRRLTEIGISEAAIATREGIVAFKIARVLYAAGDRTGAAGFLARAGRGPISLGNRLRMGRYHVKLACRARLPRDLVP
ncbi:glycosyltransferase family 2 protein [Prosthecomicrobium pneumaticum]|uniref:Glycosyltransferase involved in cell wall biosynthesis n=1 Tax=Prosthecomicrobium pneumaticum TaxID=81895 RepID=A0A7W9FQD1_9HYPH|nr:glycosyltransferase family 2 protein [Prosthecomicrobium pneumaticum]MBB5754889.1 glycosyltransferase involved in cell wall biosynthesis [Prosthecomicrobium pneumaticum]